MPAQAHRPIQTGDNSQAQCGPAQSPNSSTSTSTSTSTSPPPGGSGANPSELTDGAGNNTTRHEQPTIDDSFNAPQSEIGVTMPDQMNVRILHGATNPLSVGCPREEALYEVVDRQPVSHADPSIHSIIAKSGDTATPGQNEALLDPNALYIGGTPTQEDIHQVGFADCYFLASLVHVINQDPAHVKAMVSGNRTAATVSLFTYDGTQWNPWTYSTDSSLAVSVDQAGNRLGLIGASFRVANLPVRSDWWVEDQAGDLVICRKEYFEAALWAPVLEKAYAAYIEANGQYGGYDSANAHTGTGYSAINGGIADYSYLIMYGNAATAAETTVNYTPGVNNVSTNLPAIRNLLQLSGDGVANNQRFMMTAGISPDDSVTRLGQLVNYILGTTQVAQYPTLKRHLGMLKTEITNWTNATTNKNAKRDIVIQRARNLATPGNWPLLHSNNAPKEYRDLNDLCCVVMNLGTDHSTGQRSVYAWHSYTVQSAAFRDSTGAALTVTLANLSTTSSQIDPVRSTVHMRNPHGTNIPNPDASTDPPNQNDGVFDVSLDQFFRDFSFQQHGTVTV